MAAITGTVIAAGTAAASAYSAHQQGEAADDAMAAQESQAQRENALRQEQVDFSRQQYQEWRDMFWPVIEQLRTESMADEGPDLEAVTADVGAAYDTSREIAQRNRERRGLRPSDGGFGATDRRYALGRARGLVTGRNNARDNHRDRQFARLGSVAGMGMGQRGATTGLVTGALSGAANTAAGQQGLYGGLAQMHGQNAAANMQAFTGYDWGSLFSNLDDSGSLAGGNADVGGG